MNVKNLFLTGLAFTCLTLGSCVPEKDLHEEKPITYSKVHLNIGGECIVTEKPMNRASTTSKNLYGINVAMLIKSDANVTIKPYAYGIFDEESVKNLELNLIDTYAYRISCTMIADGIDSLALGNSGFVRPFTLDRNRTTYGTITNKFITAERPDGNQLYMHDLDNAQIGTIGQANTLRPFIKRYHGTIDTPIITEYAVQNDLEVFRRYFGIQIKTPKLQPQFKMKVQIDDSPAIWLSNSNQESEILYVSMKNLTTKVETSKILTDNGKLIATVYEEGKEGKQILNYSIAFKRNYLHTISITNIDTNGTPGNITVSVDSEEELLSDGSIDLPWQE